ncbi:MAG: glycoside hydrolase family 2 TIM barrel-domain containing protein, partial [Polaribacter sp.]|nr:glycoside hydrolase family 2 TIM barrel-domain containing protein [Polaribacter sp.]
MKNIFPILIFYLLSIYTYSQKNKVVVLNNEQGIQLVVNDTNFIINGMNWDYFPIGTNYTYSLWEQPGDFIKSVLDTEMSLLKEMGVNSIRVYMGIQPKWITYIYENYGIYTMINHSFGRYGLLINGVWVPATNYGSVEVQKVLMEQVSKMAEEYKNTPGLLLYLLGNENNYGLFWSGAETEDFPDDENEKRKVGETSGRAMYKLMNEVAVQIKKIDNSHPVAICNGDLLYLEIIAQECKDIDIFGTNMYRGKSFGNAFERVKNELNLPIMFTEFGSDAFNE